MLWSCRGKSRKYCERGRHAIGYVLAGAYVVAGAMLVLGDPDTAILWVVGTLFLVFYLMSALSSYAALLDSVT